MLSARGIGGTGFDVCISIDPHDSAHHHNFTCDNEVQSIPGILESKLWSHIHWESVQHQKNRNMYGYMCFGCWLFLSSQLQVSKLHRSWSFPALAAFGSP